MDAIRKLERKIYPCKEIDCNDYERFPLASDEEFAYMEAECADTSTVHAFSYVRKGVENYVEVYIYDVMNPGFIRFIILDGHRLSAEDEDRFFEYINLKYDRYSPEAERFKAFSRKVCRTFPQWRYLRYSMDEFKFAFIHMYYVSHPGPREILFKAQLNELAFKLSKIDSYNVMGTDPESILNAPVKLLRILDNHMLTDKYMCDPVLFEKAKAIYREYSSYLNEKYLSAGQWKYLEYLYDNDGVFAGYPFMRSLFNRLKGWTQFELEEYRKYITLRDQLPFKMKKKLPKPDEIWEKASQLETLMSYAEDGYTDRLIAERYSVGLYAYEGEKYFIRYPKSVFDFCMESFNQNNCILEDYMDDHAERATTILFLRRKDAPEKSFVTMEITNSYEIYQVYGNSNSLPPRDVYEFLWEYANALWLRYNPYRMLAIYSAQYSEVLDDELFDYMDELFEIYDRSYTQERIPVDRNNTGYIQLDLEDCFPELFEDLKLRVG